MKKFAFIFAICMFGVFCDNAYGSERLIAIPEIEYVATVHSTPSPYSNVSNPYWKLIIKFKEIGGKSGYTIIQCLRTVQDTEGNYWSTDSSSKYDTLKINKTVNANGTISWDTFLSGESFVNATVTLKFYFDNPGGPENTKTAVFTLRKKQE